MSAPIWMPVYVKDFLADTAHLNPTEWGVLGRLIYNCWIRGGVLPSDESRLIRLTGATEAEWRDVRESVMAFFVEREDGWHSPVLDEELSKAGTLIEKRRAAGLASKARRAAQNEPPATHEGTCVTTHEPTHVGTHVGTHAPTNDQQVSLQLQSQLQSQSQTDIPSPSETGAADASPTPKPLPVRDQLWAKAIPFLQDTTGKSRNACASFLGQLLKAAGDDCALVLSKIEAAEDLRPAEIGSWLMAACKPDRGPPVRSGFTAMRLRAEAEGRSRTIDGNFLAFNEIPY